MSDKKEKRTEKKFQLKSTFGAGILCAVIVLVMLIKGISVQPSINKNNQQIAELEGKIQTAYAEQAEVDEMQKNPDSDEFIRKIAREELGMVGKDEIVFIDIAEK